VPCCDIISPSWFWLHIIVYSVIHERVSAWEIPIRDTNSLAANPFPPWPSSTTTRAAGGLAEQAYQAMRDAILEGKLAAGQRIPEWELCVWLKVSRTPVREALRRLQSDGMLVHAPGGGLSVAQHDLRAVAELYDVRESLEGTAAALAARGADTTEIHILQATLESHRQLPDEPMVHARENSIFHAQVYRAAHNRFLLKSLQGLHDSVALLGRTTFAAPGRIVEAWSEHAAIVAATAQRDEAEAEALARRHVRRGYELRLNAIAVVTKAGPQNRMEQRLRLPENHAETLTNTPADRAALAVPLTSINRRSIP
jgi:DNA-binding GntR family transcriptional regulator